MCVCRPTYVFCASLNSRMQEEYATFRLKELKFLSALLSGARFMFLFLNAQKHLNIFTVSNHTKHIMCFIVFKLSKFTVM